MDSPSITEQAERPYISTGHLPDPETVQELVSDARWRSKTNTDCPKFPNLSDTCKDSERFVRHLHSRHQRKRLRG